MENLLNGFIKITNKNVSSGEGVYVTLYKVFYIKKDGSEKHSVKLVLSKEFSNMIKKEKYIYLDIFYNERINAFAFKLSKEKEEINSVVLSLKTKGRYELTSPEIVNMLMKMFNVVTPRDINCPMLFSLDTTNYDIHNPASSVIFIFR